MVWCWWFSGAELRTCSTANGGMGAMTNERVSCLRRDDLADTTEFVDMLDRTNTVQCIYMYMYAE
jgi:hypothetical protein